MSGIIFSHTIPHCATSQLGKLKLKLIMCNLRANWPATGYHHSWVQVWSCLSVSLMMSMS